MKKKLAVLEGVLLSLLILLLPTQLAVHFWPSYAFVYGIRVDYLAPAVYLSDLVGTTLVLLWLIRDVYGVLRVFRKNWVCLALFILIAFFNTIFSTVPLLSFWKWLKVTELILMFFYFSNLKNLERKKYIYAPLFYSLVVFSLLGIYQFLFGRTSGLFYLLGERSFNLTTPGIALVQFLGSVHLRAYSTFPHPNSMAGFLVASLIFLFATGFFKKGAFQILGVLIIALATALTFSLSMLVGGGCILALYFLRRREILFAKLVRRFFFLGVLASLVLPLFSRGIFLQSVPLGEKVSERIDLAYISGGMISQKFLFGEGLNTFIVNIPQFKGVNSYSWTLQPVHNIFLLIFSEVGLTGLLFFLYIFYKLISKSLMKKELLLALFYLFVFLTGMFDHYWLTIQQNALLFLVVVGLSLNSEGL